MILRIFVAGALALGSAVPASANKVVVEAGTTGTGGTGVAGAGSRAGGVTGGQRAGTGIQVTTGGVLRTYATPTVRTNSSAAGAATADPALSLGRTLPADAASAISGPGRGAAFAPARESARPGATGEAAASVEAVEPLQPQSPPPRGGAVLDPKGAGAREKTGVGALDSTGERLDAAKTRQKKGDSGAVGATLDDLFDFAVRKQDGGESSLSGTLGAQEAAAAAADPKVLGADRAAEQLAGLGEAAGPADSAFLYERAVAIAREAGKPELAAKLLSRASGRAVERVNAAGTGALAAAARGRKTEALRFTKSVFVYNELFSRGGQGYIANYPAFRDAVKTVLGAALESPGKALPEPKVSFSPVAGPRGARLKALVELPAGLGPLVKPVPVSFAADLAIPEIALPWEEPLAASERAMHESFALTPQGGPRDFYRAARAEGYGRFRSFWIAAGRYLGASLAGLWQRVKAFVVSLLRKLGVLREAAGSFALELSGATLEALRGAPAVRLVPARAPLPADGLGYRRYPTLK